MDITRPFIVLLQSQDWFATNGALLVAVVALVSAIATGIIGIKQKRTPTGEAQLDDERQYRLELRSENRDLKAEVAAVEKLNDTLTAQNRQLQKENEKLTEIKETLEVNNQSLQEKVVELMAEVKRQAAKITELNGSIADLTLKVKGLERRREPRTGDNDNASTSN